jgi:hypothetical protein
MAENAKRPAAQTGRSGDAGVGFSCEQHTITDAGVLSLEHHISERESAQLLNDLRLMNAAPSELDAVLSSRRRLTIQALRKRGAG